MRVILLHHQHRGRLRKEAIRMGFVAELNSLMNTVLFKDTFLLQDDSEERPNSLGLLSL